MPGDDVAKSVEAGRTRREGGGVIRNVRCHRPIALTRHRYRHQLRDSKSRNCGILNYAFNGSAPRHQRRDTHPVRNGTVAATAPHFPLVSGKVQRSKVPRVRRCGRIPLSHRNGGIAPGVIRYEVTHTMKMDGGTPARTTSGSANLPLRVAWRLWVRAAHAEECEGQAD